MRTGQTLTVFRRPPPKIGDTPPENLETTPPEKMETTPPPVNRMTDACENITLAKTSFQPVIISLK